MTTAEDFTCTVDPDFFEDEECGYEKSALLDSCPKHERNWHALTRRYVAEEINSAAVYDGGDTPLPEFNYAFRRKQVSAGYHGYNALATCRKWSFDHASIGMLWTAGCPSDFERALILTMEDGSTEMFELSEEQYEMLTHHTRNCRCREREFHDGLCSIACIESHGLPERCRGCGDRHCRDHADRCMEAEEPDDDPESSAEPVSTAPERRHSRKMKGQCRLSFNRPQGQCLHRRAGNGQQHPFLSERVLNC